MELSCLADTRESNLTLPGPVIRFTDTSTDTSTFRCSRAAVWMMPSVDAHQTAHAARFSIA